MNALWANMNEVEHAAFEAFWRKHQKKCDPKHGIFVRIVPTGIGVAYEVSCPDCGKSKNITDYECW